MRKVIITMSIVFALAVGGVFHLTSFLDITPDAVACDNDKGSAEGTGSTDSAG